jgi:hypothetical protein
MTADDVQTPAFESLAAGDRARAAAAASQFLLRHDYVSLQQAAQERGQSLQEFWDEIMAEAGLPACTLPVFAMID